MIIKFILIKQSIFQKKKHNNNHACNILCGLVAALAMHTLIPAICALAVTIARITGTAILTG